MAMVLLETAVVHPTTIVPMSLEMVAIALSEIAMLLQAEVLLHALPQTTAHLVMAIVLSEVETEEVASEEAVPHAATETLAEAVTSVADIDDNG